MPRFQESIAFRNSLLGSVGKLPEKADVVLIEGCILRDPSVPRIEPHGTTVISGNRLAKVNVPINSDLSYDEIIDCSNCLIMPGLVNGHNHAAMSLLRGIADDLPLDKWLQNYIFPAEGKHATQDFVYLGAKLSAVEMALSGTTTFADGYFHMEEAARAATEVGLRAVVAQGVLDVPTPDAPVPGSWKSRAEAFMEQCPRDGLITPALFCHSPYLCSPGTLQQARDLAAKHGCLLFSHVSETASEVESSIAQHGCRPMEHLNNLGILGKGFVAVHGVHLSEAEKDLLSQTGTSVVHCPESNMKLASGAADVSGLLARGVTVGIGTDGPASNNNLDLFEEMRSASLMAKLISGNPEALDCRTVIKMATVGGAKALGMDDSIGSLDRGKLADVIVVDLDRIHLTPVYDVFSHLVYAARGCDVRHVLVNGKLVVRNGRMVTVDEAELKARVRAKAKKIGATVGRGTMGAHERHG